MTEPVDLETWLNTNLQIPQATPPREAFEFTLIAVRSAEPKLRSPDPTWTPEQMRDNQKVLNAFLRGLAQLANTVRLGGREPDEIPELIQSAIATSRDLKPDQLTAMGAIILSDHLSARGRSFRSPFMQGFSLAAETNFIASRRTVTQTRLIDQRRADALHYLTLITQASNHDLQDAVRKFSSVHSQHAIVIQGNPGLAHDAWQRIVEHKLEKLVTNTVARRGFLRGERLIKEARERIALIEGESRKHVQRALLSPLRNKPEITEVALRDFSEPTNDLIHDLLPTPNAAREPAINLEIL